MQMQVFFWKKSRYPLWFVGLYSENSHLKWEKGKLFGFFVEILGNDRNIQDKTCWHKKGILYANYSPPSLTLWIVLYIFLYQSCWVLSCASCKEISFLYAWFDSKWICLWLGLVSIFKLAIKYNTINESN